MLFSTLLLSTPLLALAVPTSSKAPVPTSVNIELYQGTESSGQNVNCGYNVANSTWSAGVCTNIVTQGLSVPYSNTTDTCVFQLYTGTTTCDNAPTVYHLPKGTGSQCIATGVEDGGKWYHGSGIWKC